MMADVLAGARSWAIFTGDVLDGLRQLPDDSIHCVVTSPPYWGLRDYGVAGQLGLEPTYLDYVDKLVVIFREVRRVLRPDGSLWLNLGDTYCTNPHGPRDAQTSDPKYRGGRARRGGEPNRTPQPELKHKDLVGVPWLAALALRRDGWYLRRDIVWSKPNAMPEPVEDRPTAVHEYVFLLTKGPRYFFDATAVKEPVTGNAHARGRGVNPKAAASSPGARQNASFSAAVKDLVADRNIRTVWTINSRAFPGAHFATFPPELPERCIKAGTSEHGACPACGACWERILGEPIPVDGPRAGNKQRLLADGEADGRLDTHMGRGIPRAPKTRPTIGWRPTCECPPSDPVPCIVLDPFAGAGTTVMVARRLRRRALGIELKPDYVAMAERRIDADAPLFNREGGAA